MLRYFQSSADQSDLLNGRELFSFGSGSFYDGTDAVEVMESDSGNFIACAMKFDSPVILDKKKVLSHLSGLPCIDKAVSLRELLKALEDKGEAPLLDFHVQKTCESDAGCKINLYLWLVL